MYDKEVEQVERKVVIIDILKQVPHWHVLWEVLEDLLYLFFITEGKNDEEARE